VTLKDTDNNMVWNDEDGTLTYKPRKIYTFVPELSGPGLNPYEDVVTVPNIPLWTGLHQLKKSGADGLADYLAGQGLGTPFVDVTFDGLLWGYKDELPCAKMDKPAGCFSNKESNSPFSQQSPDDFEDEEDSFGNFEDFRRRKRSVEEGEKKGKKKTLSYYDLLSKPKQEFVNCRYLLL